MTETLEKPVLSRRERIRRQIQDELFADPEFVKMSSDDQRFAIRHRIQQILGAERSEQEEFRRTPARPAARPPAPPPARPLTPPPARPAARPPARPAARQATSPLADYYKRASQRTSPFAESYRRALKGISPFAESGKRALQATASDQARIVGEREAERAMAPSAPERARQVPQRGLSRREWERIQRAWAEGPPTPLPERMGEVVAGAWARLGANLLHNIGRFTENFRAPKTLSQEQPGRLRELAASLGATPREDLALPPAPADKPGAIRRASEAMARFVSEQGWEPEGFAENVLAAVPFIAAAVATRGLSLKAGATPMLANAAAALLPAANARAETYRREIAAGSDPGTAALRADSMAAFEGALNMLLLAGGMRLAGGSQSALAARAQQYLSQIQAGQTPHLTATQIAGSYGLSGLSMALLGQAREAGQWVIEGKEIPEGVAGRRVADFMTGLIFRGLFHGTGQTREAQLRNMRIWRDDKGVFAYNRTTGETLGYNPQNKQWVVVTMGKPGAPKIGGPGKAPPSRTGAEAPPGAPPSAQGPPAGLPAARPAAPPPPAPQAATPGAPPVPFTPSPIAGMEQATERAAVGAGQQAEAKAEAAPKAPEKAEPKKPAPKPADPDEVFGLLAKTHADMEAASGEEKTALGEMRDELAGQLVDAGYSEEQIARAVVSGAKKISDVRPATLSEGRRKLRDQMMEALKKGDMARAAELRKEWEKPEGKAQREAAKESMPKRSIITGYHATFPLEAAARGFIQRAAGYSIALDKPWEQPGGASVAVSAEIDPLKILDPNGLIDGTNREKSRADLQRMTQIFNEQGLPPSRNMRDIANMRRDILIGMGYEGEAGWTKWPEGGNRELVVFDESKVSAEKAAEHARGVRAAADIGGVQAVGAKNLDAANKELLASGERPVNVKVKRITKTYLQDLYSNKKPPVVGDSFTDEHGFRIEITSIQQMPNGTTQIDYMTFPKKGKGRVSSIYISKVAQGIAPLQTLSTSEQVQGESNKRSLDTFTAGMDAKTAARTRKTLAAKGIWDGETMTRQAFVEREAAKPDMKAEYSEKLKSWFIGDFEATKTEADYFNHLREAPAQTAATSKDVQKETPPMSRADFRKALPALEPDAKAERAAIDKYLAEHPEEGGAVPAEEPHAEERDEALAAFVNAKENQKFIAGELPRSSLRNVHDARIAIWLGEKLGYAPKDIAAFLRKRYEPRKVAQTELSKETFNVAVPQDKARITGNWRVVSAWDLLTSDDDEFERSLQPRNRDTVASKLQVEKIAKNPDPGQLDVSGASDSGAPFIDPKGNVISGNARVMGLRLAYREKGTAAKYKAFVAERAQQLGLGDVSQIEDPVLVREISDTGGLTWARLAELSNRVNILPRTAAEIAEADAKAIIENDLLRFYNPGETGMIRTTSNYPFLRQFIKYAGAEELLTSKGEFSSDIDKRVQRAILAAILGNSEDTRELIRQAVEDAANLGLSNAINGIMTMAGEVARVGRRNADVDLGPYLSKAIEQLLAWKKSADVKTAVDWIDQGVLFGKPLTLGERTVFEILAKASSAKQVREFIGHYIAIADRIEPGPPLMAGVTGPRTAEDVLTIIYKENRRASATGQAKFLFPKRTGKGSVGQEPPAGGEDTGSGGVPAKGGGALGAGASRTDLKRELKRRGIAFNPDDSTANLRKKLGLPAEEPEVPKESAAPGTAAQPTPEQLAWTQFVENRDAWLAEQKARGVAVRVRPDYNPHTRAYHLVGLDGAGFGGPYKTFEESARAADEENARLAEWDSRDMEEKAKFPVLKWGKDGPGYVRTLRSNREIGEMTAESRHIGWIAQPYGHDVRVYYAEVQYGIKGFYRVGSGDKPSLMRVAGDEITKWRDTEMARKIQADIAAAKKEAPIAPAPGTASALTIESYSEKAIVVRGDTKPQAATLRDLGGRWNRKLRGGPGWIFPKTQEAMVRKALGIGEQPTPATTQPWEMTLSAYQQLAARVAADYDARFAKAMEGQSDQDPQSPTYRNKSQDVFAEIKKRWNLPWLDFGTMRGQGHKAMVRDALDAGKLSPDRARELGHFDTYPDLAEKYRESAPAAAQEQAPPAPAASADPEQAKWDDFLDVPQENRKAVSTPEAPAQEQKGAEHGPSAAGSETLRGRLPAAGLRASYRAAAPQGRPADIGATGGVRLELRRRPGLRVAGAERVPVPGSHIPVGAYKGVPYPDQLLAINLAIDAFKKGMPGFMLADAPGVGKTIVFLIVADQMAKLTGKPTLIIVPANSVAGLQKNADMIGVNLKGGSIEAITYNAFGSRKGGLGDYGLVIYDESHSLKNADSARAIAAYNVRAQYTMFVSATPLDRATDSAYFMSEITGKDMATIAQMLGFRMVTQTDPRTGDQFDMPVLLPDMTWPEVKRNICKMRNAGVAKGALIRREFPFWGTVEQRPNVALTEQDIDDQRQIDDWWQDVIDASFGTKRANMAGQRSQELRRWLESKKADTAWRSMQAELAEGRSVVLVAENVSPSIVKGLDRKEVVGVITQIADRLKAAGIDFAKIYGSGNKEAEIQRFQTNAVRVALTTPQSGGASIDLDDQTGTAPRTMIIATLNWSGNAIDQMMFRISRRNTKTPGRVIFLEAPDGIADHRAAVVVRRKLEALRAIQEGADIDLARGIAEAFTPAAQGGGQQRMVHRGAAPQVQGAQRARSKPVPVTGRSAAPFAVTDAETPGGRKLIGALHKDAKRKKGEPAKVGRRSIIEFVNNLVHMKMIVGKSQTTRSYPALYQPGPHLERTRVPNWQLGFHEAGHGLIYYVADTADPQWYQTFAPMLLELTDPQVYPDTEASEQTDQEGMAELVRRYIADYQSIPQAILAAFDAELGRTAPDILSGLRDAHRAYQYHMNRPLTDFRESESHDTVAADKKLNYRRRKYAVLHAVLGGRPVFHRMLRDEFDGIMGAWQIEKHDPTNLTRLAHFLVSGEYRRMRRVAVAYRKKIADTPAGRLTAWNLKVNAPFEIARLYQGTENGKNEGVRAPVWGEGFDALPELTEEEAKLAGGLTDPVAAMRYVGFNVPATPQVHGEYVRLTRESFGGIVYKLGKDWEAFETYGQFRRTLFLHGKFTTPEHEYAYPGQLDAVTTDQMRQYVADAEKAHPEWKDRFREINELNDALLLIAVLSGEKTPAEAIRMRVAHDDNYWPQLRRMGTAPTPQARGAAAKADLDSQLRKLDPFGSELALRPLKDMMQTRIGNILGTYYENLARQAVENAADALAEMDMAPFDIRKESQRLLLPMHLDPKLMAKADIDEQREVIADYFNRQTAARLGVKIAETDTPKQVRDALADGGVAADQIFTGPDITYDAPGKPIIRGRRPNAPMVLSYFRPGLGRLYRQLTDPLVWKLLAGGVRPQGFPHAMAERMNELLGPIGSNFRRWVTQDPAYGLVNALFRDMMYTMFTGDGLKSLIPFRLLMKGLGNKIANLFGKGYVVPEASWLMSREGEYGRRGMPARIADFFTEGVVPRDWHGLDDLGRALSVPSMAVGAVGKIMDVRNLVTGGRTISPLGEEATRAGEFVAQKQEGRSTAYAQMEHDTISGYFKSSPGDPTVRELFAFTPFIRGITQVVWGMAERVWDPDPLRAAFFMYVKIPTFMAMAAALAGAVMLLLRARHPDDDDYEAVRERERLRTSEDRMRYMDIEGIRVPFPNDILGSFTSLAYNATMGYLVDEHVDGGAMAWEAVRKASSMLTFGDFAQPQFKATVGTIANYDFVWDRQIVPQWMKDKYPNNPELWSWPDTPEFYRKIVAGKVSPLLVRFWAINLFTNHADRLITVAERAWKGQKPVPTLADLPVGGRFFSREPSGLYSRPVSDLRDAELRYQALRKTGDAFIQRMAQKGKTEESELSAKEAAEFNELRGKIRALTDAHEAMLAIDKIWDEIKLESRKPKPDENRVAILKRQMTQAAKTFWAEQKKAD